MNFLLLEDGTSKLLLEDDTSRLLLEPTSADDMDGNFESRMCIAGWSMGGGAV